MPPRQPDLFAASPPPGAPQGLVYTPALIDEAEEQALAAAIAALPLKPFEFHGYLGKRRVHYFGKRYDFNGGGLGPAEPLPGFLLPLRDKAAALAGVAPEAFVHALCTEYAPGAGIGWHRDRPQFGEVVGVSLLAPCSFRLRRRRPGGFDRYAFTCAPRSAYLLSSEARTVWEHSIPEMDALRYSVTFRTLR